MKKVKRTKVRNKNIIKKIGQDGGYLVNQCPVLIPKENIKIFTDFQKACSKNPYGKYGNALKVKLH